MKCSWTIWFKNIMWQHLIQQSWIFHEYFMNHVNSWIIQESFMNRGYKYSWNFVHELWFMNISRICLDACIFMNNLLIVHDQFMNPSSWTKYDCRSWIVHEYSWIVHNIHQVIYFISPRNGSGCRRENIVIRLPGRSSTTVHCDATQNNVCRWRCECNNSPD